MSTRSEAEMPLGNASEMATASRPAPVTEVGTPSRSRSNTPFNSGRRRSS